MLIAIPHFPQVTLLDAIGPYEVLQRLPDAQVVFVGAEVGPVRTDNGFCGVLVDQELEAVPSPDVVVVPGGIGTRALIGDERMRRWLRGAHRTTSFTTSVCTGSLLLADAGLLAGLTATTHWSAHDILEKLGAVPTGQRVVEHLTERVITAAGVSSGIDMALRLAELLTDEDTAKAMQLMIEYDPQPPFDAGSVDKAGPRVLARVKEIAASKN